MKAIATMAMAGCVIGLLTGCGVPQDKYDAMVAQLTNEKTEMETSLRATITENETALNSEKAKSRKLQNDLNDSVERIKELNASSAEMNASVDGLKQQIADAQADLADVKDDLATAVQDKMDLLDQCDSLKMEAKEVQRRFDMLRAALLKLNKTNPDDLAIDLQNVLEANDMGGGVMQDEGPSSSTSSLSGLLDEMGNM